MQTSPYHCICLVLMSSKSDIVTFIFCLIIEFIILDEKNGFLKIFLNFNEFVEFTTYVFSSAPLVS
jgi:hypothetical protein